MGRLVQRAYIVNKIEYTMEDLEKQRMRHDRKSKFPEPTEAMVRFCKRLNPCPICGATPKPSIVGEYGNYSIKMNCSSSSFHISCGDWYKGLAKAGKGWNQRTKDEHQIKTDIENEIRWASSSRPHENDRGDYKGNGGIDFDADEQLKRTEI